MAVSAAAAPRKDGSSPRDREVVDRLREIEAGARWELGDAREEAGSLAGAS